MNFKVIETSIKYLCLFFGFAFAFILGRDREKNKSTQIENENLKQNLQIQKDRITDVNVADAYLDKLRDEDSASE